ncbi:hypothetical protein FOL47_010939 [Perkinsus chesapeaki]|uniref:Uncharacterized protein n=1 Tax=Perkinsus chesapeaki TaxID=330153 RepID=A0A7J6N1D2_PERCH|nr:hypothetical protein FOL47_010939 [Perkinsus chesapeaki]
MPPKSSGESDPLAESRATLAAEVRALREELRQVKRGGGHPPPLQTVRESLDHPLAATPWWRRSTAAAAAVPREIHDCTWQREDSFSPERVSEEPMRKSRDQQQPSATPVMASSSPKSISGGMPSDKAAPASSPVTRQAHLPSTALPHLMPTEWGERRAAARRPGWVPSPAEATRYLSPERSRATAVLEGRLMELDEEVRALRLENASLRAELEIVRRTSPANRRGSGGYPRPPPFPTDESEHLARPPSRGRSPSRTRRQQHQCSSPRMRSRTPDGHTQTSWQRYQWAQRAKAKRQQASRQ